MDMKFLRGMEETLREKIRLLIFLGSWNPNFVNKKVGKKTVNNGLAL